MTEALAPHCIDLVRTTFPMVFAPGSDAGSIFYNRLFTLAPTLQRFFNSTDMNEQAERLVAGLAEAVGLLHDRDELRAYAALLGARHDTYGINPDSYDLIGAALLHTVRTRLGDACTDEVLEAWTRAYAGIAAEMLVGHTTAAQ